MLWPLIPLRNIQRRLRGDLVRHSGDPRGRERKSGIAAYPHPLLAGEALTGQPQAQLKSENTVSGALEDRLNDSHALAT